MPAEITQGNVRLLIPGKAARVAAMIAERRGLPLGTALLAFYRSRTYRELERESSKYWHYSPAQLFAVGGFARGRRDQARRGPGRSILLPYKDEILAAWRCRRSAREIAGLLECRGVPATARNVREFIRRHSRNDQESLPPSG